MFAIFISEIISLRFTKLFQRQLHKPKLTIAKQIQAILQDMLERQLDGCSSASRNVPGRRSRPPNRAFYKIVQKVVKQDDSTRTEIICPAFA